MPEEIKELLSEYRDGKNAAGIHPPGRRSNRHLAVADKLIDTVFPASAAAQVDPADPAVLWHTGEYAGKAGPTGAGSSDSAGAAR